MDPPGDGTRFGGALSPSPSQSSSSVAFFSANQSSFSSNSRSDTTSVIMESENLGREGLSSTVLRPHENASTSTAGIYNTTLSSYAVQDSYDYCKHSKNVKGKKINRLLKVSSSPPSFFSNRLKSCDVYIGFHGRAPLLLRFTNWLRAELEAQGLTCFVTDRSRCRNLRKHKDVEKAMDGSTFGVIILTRNSFRNPYTVEELRFFSGKKNLVPLYFDLSPEDCLVRDITEKRGELWEKNGGELWLHYGGVEQEWREAVSSLSCAGDWKLEANDGKWRDCILRAVMLLAMRLGRRSIVDRLTKWREKAEGEEFPFPQNQNFVGRKKELSELEFVLFGDVCGQGEKDFFEIKSWPRLCGKDEKKRRKGKGKEPVLWRESEKEIEMRKNTDLLPEFKKSKKSAFRRRPAKIVYGKGIACVSGDPGIGKTELLLEFAYRFHQRYKMVLWIGGESRYIRQNYLDLWSFLEIDVGVEGSPEKGYIKTKTFEEQEESAIARVRKELMRNIPFLVIIDNLESEKDWWDQKLIMDLLPRFGGETHVIISTRLPKVMNLDPLKLSFLSGFEAMSLMQGGRISRDQSVTEIDALISIEEKLGRLTLGLAIVGAILSQLPINPSRLLDTINRMPSGDVTWSGRDSNWLRRNSFLLQIFEVCFSIFDHADGEGSLATRMVLASGWFAPSQIPINVLALAAQKMPEKPKGFWKNMLMCGLRLRLSYDRRSENEACSLLVRFSIGRGCKKEGFIQFNGLVRLYARMRGVRGIANSVVEAIVGRGTHTDHVWAACYLTLGLRKDPVVVEMKVPELLFFAKEVVVPLAVRAFVGFSRCGAAVEVLRMCEEVMEEAEERFVAPAGKGLVCWRGAEMRRWLWEEMAVGRAGVLEVRAKLMVRGGKFDVGDDLIRKAIFIRESVCGEEHPETVAAREMLGKFTRMASGVQSRG